MTWTTRTLGEICDEVGGTIRTGPFGSQLHESDYEDEGVPVVMPKDIVEGSVSDQSIARVSEETAARLAQHALQVGDIVYGRRGDIGRRALIGPREHGWLCGTGCLRVSLGGEVLEPQFLHYYLGEARVTAWIANQAIGATMPNLNTAIMRSVRVRYPEKQSQQRIAAILAAYDDLIANNTRRIALLEEMARSLYREWFVEFRFPGHENVETAESALGPVPRNWSVKRIGDDVELAYGKALKADEREDGSFPVYGSSGVVGHHSASLVEGPGIIVGRKGNVGSVHWSDYDFYPIDTVFYVKSALSLYYIFFNFQTQNFINNDAAVPGLNRNQAYSLRLVVPDDAILERFDAMLDPVFSQVRLLREKNIVLRRTRDLLLPRLISGELNVSELDIDTGELSA